MSQCFTMKIEPLTWGIDVDLWFEHPDVVAKSFYEKGATAILKVPVKIPATPSFVPRGVYSCVTVVKAMVGVRQWRVWTPKGLFGYLVRRQSAELLDVGG